MAVAEGGAGKPQIEGRLSRMEKRWTHVHGLRLFARTWERRGAPELVLVHGLAVSGRYFVPLAEELAPFASVAAPDLPGFGRSTKPRRTLTVAELALALAAWLEHNGLERPVLVANSLGCQFAVELVVRAPERVGGLVLIGPALEPRTRSRLRWVLRWTATAFLERPPLHLVVARDALRAGPARVWATFEDALRDPLDGELARVAAPTLVLRGEHDPIAPQEACERMAAALPNGRLAVVPGAGHALNWSRPRDAARAIRAWLEEAE